MTAARAGTAGGPIGWTPTDCRVLDADGGGGRAVSRARAATAGGPIGWTPTDCRVLDDGGGEGAP